MTPPAGLHRSRSRGAATPKLAALAGLLALGGCASAEFASTLDNLDKTFQGVGFERETAIELAPAPRPAQRFWRDIRVRDKAFGAERTIAVRPVGRDAIQATQPDGCVWTRSADWFSPSFAWSACGARADWSTAKGTVRRTGSLWPLKEGATAAYTRTVVSKTGRSSTRTTRCAVVDQVLVTRSTGAPIGAFKVVCQDGRRTRTTWWSADEGPVIYRQVHRRRGVEQFWERVNG